jgi:LacI family transcriptional regulator
MRPQVLLVFLMRFEESAIMLKGITQYERSHRKWASFLDDEARAEVDRHWLKEKKWSGVISRNTTPSLARSCRELGIPLVDLNDTPPTKGIPKIRPDNDRIGRLGAEHFMERGLQHYGYAGFGNEPWSCERREGFMAALREAGHIGHVFDVEYPGNVTPKWDSQQKAALADWLQRLPKPVGVMACVDMRAFQVMGAAETAGVLVPEEVALLGANNDAIRCDLSYPPLSSVAPNAFESGYRAAELLDRMMQGEDPGPVDVRIEPLGVVTRPSSDVLAIHDPNVATALSHIREHACQGLTVAQLARHAHASRSQLERKFRRYLGRSPQAEIRRVQTTKIKELLLETDFPLKKIAGIAGFQHVEYMCVAFKRMTGHAPGAYRKQFQDPARIPSTVRAITRPQQPLLRRPRAKPLPPRELDAV